MGESVVNFPEVEHEPRQMPGILRVVELGEDVDHPPNVTPEQPESRQFLKVDEFLAYKAAEFYGIGRAYVATQTSQMRLLNRAMSAIPRIDHEGKAWRDSFETVPAIKKGETYLKAKIKAVDEEGQPTKIRVDAAMQRSGVREAIVAQYRAVNDPAMHIIDFLQQWPKDQSEKPKDEEVSRAKRLLTLFFFSVHGQSIVASTEKLLKEESLARHS